MDSMPVQALASVASKRGGRGCRHDTHAPSAPNPPLQNEGEVAAGIAASGVPRREVFVTSKVSPYQQV